MGLPLLVVSTMAVGGALAWLTYQRELMRVWTPTRCSRAIDESYGLDASSTPDSVLLARLLVHRDRCMDDAAYVDQTRRLMLNLLRTDDARALLDEAESRRIIARDELEAQRAWVDVEESRIAESRGDSLAARAARARASATIQRLRQRWPEWAVPYTIMREMKRTSLADASDPSSASEPDELQRAARRRIESGAIVRSLTQPQAIVVAFLAGVLGILGLATIARAVLSIREMQQLKTSTIAGAEPGYVELTGTLHLPPRAEAVIGPLTKHAGVWYSVESNFGSKGSQTFRDRSAQPFLLRDASGEVAIDPSGLTVRTRHSVTKFGSVSGISSSPRSTERMLREGDKAYVLGELATVPAVGKATRRVRLPEDGRRLIVSNYSEGQLIWRETLWLAFGAVLTTIAVAVIFWGYEQRFLVSGVP